MDVAETRIAVVVVTFNRKALLLQCLAALRVQSPRPRIHIIDNASGDGTSDTLREQGWLDDANVDYHRLDDNLGGAGGFAAGLARAVEQGADWVWMMDDDAMPHPDALGCLAATKLAPENLYGSAAVSGDRLAWPPLITESGVSRLVHDVAHLPPQGDVTFLPFLGIFVHRSMVARIGLPDAGYFLAADDVEYCWRARAAGARVIIVGGSRIEHPPAILYPMRVPGRTLYCLQLPPWKRYYDTRNRLLLARRHTGFRLVTQTIPGSFVRLIGALLHEPRKWAQTWAFIAGFVDGLLERKGRRHERWGIRP